MKLEEHMLSVLMADIYNKENKMEIKADQEGIEAITKLCDVALKTGGIQNMNPVSVILSSIKKLEEDEPEAEAKE